VRLLWNIITQEIGKLGDLIVKMIINEYPEEAEAVFKYYDQL